MKLKSPRKSAFEMMCEEAIEWRLPRPAFVCYDMSVAHLFVRPAFDFLNALLAQYGGKMIGGMSQIFDPPNHRVIFACYWRRL